MTGSLVISVAAFIVIFGGVLVGMFFRTILPTHHLSEDSKEVVKLGTGMVATLAALVLGLMIVSAKGTFDTTSSELRQVGAKIILLDRVMAAYGPETKEAREMLRHAVGYTINMVWPEEKAVLAGEKPVGPATGLEVVQDRLRGLKPRTDAERSLQSRALQVSGEIEEARWLLLEQRGQGSLPMPFLLILVLWLAIIFAGIGLLSPRNGTVIVVLFICVLSCACSLFLIEELDHPYRGMIMVSSTSLRTAFSAIGR